MLPTPDGPHMHLPDVSLKHLSGTSCVQSIRSDIGEFPLGMRAALRGAMSLSADVDSLRHCDTAATQWDVKRAKAKVI